MRKAESELEIEELLKSIQSSNTETAVSEINTTLNNEGINTVQDSDIIQKCKTKNANESHNKTVKKRKPTHIQQLRKKLNSLQEENDRLNTKIGKLNVTIENNRGQIKNLKRKLETEKNNSSNSLLKGENIRLKTENEKLKRENEKLRITISNQGRELNIVNNELSAVQMELYKTAKEINNAKMPTHRLSKIVDVELLELSYGIVESAFIKPAKSIISKALSKFPNIT